MENKRPFLLQGKILHYDWGGHSFIPNFLQMPPQPLETYAEYWLGAHDSHPGVVHLDHQKGILLNDLIKNFPAFQNDAQSTLAFLLKILDVKKMLSIQVHPNEIQAQKGFQQENEAGISIQHPTRTFKDPYPKPEMMVALSDFWLLHGFASTNKIIEQLESFQELQVVSNYFKENGLKKTFHWLMNIERSQITEILNNLISTIKIMPQLSKNKSAFWIKRYIELNPPKTALDRGLINIFFMNIVNLNYKQGIFQNTGILHAYLEGQNIELMTASDNVIRGGLTTKHIDIDKLLEMTCFEEIMPHILDPQPLSENVYDYPIPNHLPFRLHWIENTTNKKTLSFHAEGREILCCIESEHPICIQFHNKESLNIKKGQAVIIPDNLEYTLICDSNSILVKAFEQNKLP